MRNTVIINRVDFSTDFTKYGCSVQYVPRRGDLGGMMQNGDMKEDIRKWVAVVTLPVNDLPAPRLAKLLQACMVSSPVVTFHDTKLDAPREATFLTPDFSPQTLNLITSTGIRWYTGMTVTMEEK